MIKSDKKYSIFSIILSILGMLNALFLSLQHIFQAGFCQKGMACNAVLFKHSSQFFGVPFSFLGVGYFLVCGVLTFFYQKQVIWGGFLKKWVWLGFAISVLLLVIQVQTGFCLYCLFSFVISLLLLFTVTRFSDSKNVFSRRMVAQIVLVLILFFSCVGGLVVADRAFFPSEFVPTRLNLPEQRPESLQIGRNKSKERWVIFSDLECTKCRFVHGVVQHALNNGHNYLSLEIYFLPKTELSYKSTIQVLVADHFGRGDKAIELLFEGPKSDIELSERLGISRVNFENERKKIEYAAHIQQMRDYAEFLGIKGTPTMYRNGKWVHKFEF